jgi:dihydrofolate reductase
MRKVISSINMTLDGFCDHTAMLADDELHENVNALMSTIDTILFGRVTYQLMEDAWPSIVKEPTGNKPIDDFAVLMDNMHKIVYSRTLTSVVWNNSELATRDFEAEVLHLKNLPGKNISVGGPSIIIAMMQLDLIDEYHFCIHPVVIGRGLPLFKNISERIDFRLLDTKQYSSGAVNFRYERVKNEG